MKIMKIKRCFHSHSYPRKRSLSSLLFSSLRMLSSPQRLLEPDSGRGCEDHEERLDAGPGIPRGSQDHEGPATQKHPDPVRRVHAPGTHPDHHGVHEPGVPPRLPPR